ncbi:hypothetical protein DUNSADRAFT_9574 [Dunaliella salina]|uniref:RRM domain-containing protein n=1 Tax=Dunaliella salina TaxID=3046 RepID=A0ABQ7GH42_DUNSA|nr:hypothetical protein DUNSADRAFT_9574 [Dunaliella salina]|eukprot:KAF5833915.1 hypothetical protein DUNSADRAFT_9574 [Dunaliella salina]
MDLPPEPVYLQPHANILVRNFPPDYDIGSFQALFRQYAIIEGCRYFPTAAIPYAFIKLASVEAAHTAIKALHNSKLGGRTIIVKSAEQDCEYEHCINNLYCTNLPLSWDDNMLRSTFSRFGTVLSTKLLTALPGMPGKGGLVRMSTNEEAKAARDALNAIVPIGESIPIVVKYADSPEEKQRKVGPGRGGQQNDGAWPSQSYPAWPAPAAAPAPAPATGPNNIIVKGLTPDVDRLQLYELFAPFGGTMGVVMQGPGTAHISYADPGTAQRAVQAMNGWAYRGYPLHVTSTYHGPGAVQLASAAPAPLALPASAALPQMSTMHQLPQMSHMPAPAPVSVLPQAAPWAGY